METGIVKELLINPNDLIVNIREILPDLGYNDVQPEEYVVNKIHEIIQLSKRLLNPSSMYLVLPIDNLDRKGALVVQDIQLDISTIIASQLKGATYIAVFVCSIGKETETYSARLIDNNELLEGYALNLAASAYAEKVADRVQNDLKDSMLAKGLGITNRFSPGYCNWNVEEQQKIFTLFPSGSLNVKLNSSSLMDPVKSVSGIIGIGNNVVQKPYICKSCVDTDCLYRKTNHL